MLEVAEKFFWPCDEGKGWEACKEHCHPNATFKTDADTLINLDRLEAVSYTHLTLPTTTIV